MIHFHGGPITPDTCALKAWKGRHAFIIFANPGQLKLASEVTQSFALDNGAFSFWDKKQAVNWKDYYEFVRQWMNHPRFAFAVIPDVIGGTSDENDALIAEWPHGKFVGAPVWHMSEPDERFIRLCHDFPRVCIGSMGEYDAKRPRACRAKLRDLIRHVVDSNGYPSTVVYYQQRLYFAASTSYPQTIWASRTGDYKDFGKNNPTQDDDRIIYTYAGRQVNEIRHLIDVGTLVALTSGGEYTISGDQNKVLTPSAFSFSSQGNNGSSNVPPIAVANIALFIQEKGSVVRDLAYSFDVDGYQGSDLTILANHLFQKRSIVDWTFCIVPYSSAFCIRDDGKLLVMTYLRDQQVFAWAPQSSAGKYESTCSISEGSEDAVYFVVNRTINGQTVRYIERLSSRLFTNDEDAFFVDCGLSYDGRNTSARTMTISGGTGDWSYQVDYPVTVSGGAYFVSGDAGAQIQFPYTGTDPDTGAPVAKELRGDIVTVTNSTSVVVRFNRNVPPVLRTTATTNWQMARQTFGGLSHLEGQTVNILSDANVEPQKVVTGGAVTLESPGAVVHIGLPITAEFETLDININGQETLLDKKQYIPKVTMIVNASRGIWASTPGGEWYEYPQREFEFYDDPVDDATGKVEVKLDSVWDINSRVKVRQLDPLPLSVLAVIPRLTVGGN